ncbi:MAG: DUF3375 family protein [Chloroflexi bacterium]|nr:DUF3375 family protein [Chloroflexota bacterium]
MQQLDPAQTIRLHRLKRSLIDAAAKIIESNRRLGEQLRKLLDEQNLTEARRVVELATEIKQTAVALATNLPDNKAFLWVEAEPDVDMPWERPSTLSRMVWPNLSPTSPWPPTMKPTRLTAVPGKRW